MMNTILLVICLEGLCWGFFFKRAAFIHAAALLIFVKLFFPIIKSALLHVFFRIPRAIIKREFRATLKMHLSWWGLVKKPKHNSSEYGYDPRNFEARYTRESTIPRPSQINEIVARETANIDSELEKLTGR